MLAVANAGRRWWDWSAQGVWDSTRWHVSSKTCHSCLENEGNQKQEKPPEVQSAAGKAVNCDGWGTEQDLCNSQLVWGLLCCYPHLYTQSLGLYQGPAFLNHLSTTHIFRNRHANKKSNLMPWFDAETAHLDAEIWLLPPKPVEQAAALQQAQTVA